MSAFDPLIPLLWTAAGGAFAHTVLGVDHTLPFILLGRAQGWSRSRTLALTALGGVLHVGAALGLGLALGAAAGGLDAWRGGVEAWLLAAAGLTYACWALWRRPRAGLQAGV